MKKLLPFFLLLITSVSYTQIKYEPGYFISNNDTKTECLIKNVATYNNPTSFEYKLNESSDVVIGKIKDVKEFAVGEGYHYRRFETNVDQSSNVPGKLSYVKDPEWKKETIFLKLIFKGDVTLYHYENANIPRYFISSGNHETAEQLVYKEYMTRETGSSIFPNNLYRRQLFVALKSPNLEQSDFEKLKYNKESLLKIFLKYNNQEGKTFTNLDEKQNKSKINLKINAGIGLSNLNIKDFFGTFDYNSSGTAIRVGAEFEVILPFGQKKWSLFIEPNFQSFSDEGTADLKFGPDLVLKTDYKMIQLPAGIRHYFFIDKSKIFLDAGLNMNLPMSSSITSSGNNKRIENSVNFFGGLGFNYDRYSIEARYNFGYNLISENESWETKYTSFGIIASYNFL